MYSFSGHVEVSLKFWPCFRGQGRSVARVFVWLDGLRSLLATGRLAVWLEMGGFAWKSFWHTGAFPATPLVCALINVDGRIYGLYATL